MSTSPSIFDQYRQSVAALPPPPTVNLAGMAGPTSPGGVPSNLNIPMPAAPNVTHAPSQLDKDKASYQQVKMAGPGEEQLYHKITGSEFGQNHPILGKVLGGLAAGVTGAADIGLGTLGGGIGRLAEEQIPGTLLNHQVQLNRAGKDITTDEANAGKEAQTASENATATETGARQKQTEETTAEMPGKTASEENLQGAEAGNFNSEAWERQHPRDEWSPVAGAQGPNGEPLEHSKLTGTYRVAPGVAGAATESSTKPQETKNINVNGVPHVMQWNPKTQKFDIDQGLSGEKPASVNVNAADASVDRLATRLGKPYDAAFTKGSGQLDTIDKTLRSINSGYKGQALALPETLTSLVSGQGTGVRVTMPELEMIGQHNGVKGDIESFFSRIAGQGSMTAEDKKQLAGILSEARTRLQDKVAIHSQTLDAINGANSREEIQQADKLARKLLNDYEHADKIGTAKDGTRIRMNGGKTYNILTGEEVK